MLTFTQLKGFIRQIAQERGLDENIVESAVLDSLAYAYRYDYCNKEGIVRAIKDDLGNINYFLVKTVVDPKDIESGTIKFDTNLHLTLEEAKNYVENPQPGEEILINLPYRENFSRIAAQIAKNVMIQKLREVEKDIIYSIFKEKENSVVTGTIEKKDERGNVYVDLGKTFGILYKSEFIPKEIYRPGKRMKFFIYAVEKAKGGVVVYLSRSHPLFVPALFAMEVPEINEGLIQIKEVAREPGERSKIAVWSEIEGFDPVGACIGPRGARVLSLSEELNGEKIDVILWDPKPEKFVANALAPAKVVEVRQLPKRTMLVLVEEDQLPSAIGKNGQNIKLASHLTNWRIDVRLASKPDEPVEGGFSDNVGEIDTGAETS